MLDIDSEVLKKLSQVGYMACMKGFSNKGEIIMEGIRKIRPDQTPVLMGVAIAKISVMKYVEAAEIINNSILSKEPDNITAKCFLAVALFEIGEKDLAKNYFNEVMEKGDQNHIAICNVYTQD